MTWLYEQRSGRLFQQVATGYSGAAEGRNNPALQDRHDVGPIPAGKWYAATMIDATATHGPFVLRLTPDPSTLLFGRDGFLIHGDNKTHDASRGCIVLDRETRERIWASKDHELCVVADLRRQAALVP